MKPLTSAQTTARSVARRKDAGLIQAKVWVEPTEADLLRRYSKRLPLTKAILKELKR